MATVATYDIKREPFAQYLYEPTNQYTLNNIAQQAYRYYNAQDYTITSANTVELTINNDYSAATYDVDLYTTATASSQYIWTIDDSTKDYITINYDTNGSGCISVNKLTPEELKRLEIKERFRRNLTPEILIKRFSLGRAGKPSEGRAREALLQIIGSDRFRRYLKNGFISIKGKSGKIYQIFPGHQMTKVWVNGEHIEDLCVIMVDSSLPPSDSVIMRMLMILDSEEAFRKVANVFPRKASMFTNSGICIAA